MAVAQMMEESTLAIVKSPDPGEPVTPLPSGGSLSAGNQEPESQEVKLLRRRESNRDSARRTRRRKATEYKRLGQEVNELGRENIRLRQQVSDLTDTNKVLIESVPKLADKCKELVAENQNLKEKVRQMTEQVNSLQQQSGMHSGRSLSAETLYHPSSHPEMILDSYPVMGQSHMQSPHMTPMTPHMGQAMAGMSGMQLTGGNSSLSSMHGHHSTGGDGYSTPLSMGGMSAHGGHIISPPHLRHTSELDDHFSDDLGHL